MTSSLKINRLKFDKLTTQDWSKYRAMRAANPALYSPYFHPDYMRAIGALSKDAFIAVIEQSGETIGFLPFQQRRIGGAARPIGAPMTDYHGLISAAPLNLDMRDILRAANIGAFNMPHQRNIPEGADANNYTDCAVMRLKGYESADMWREERDSSYRRHLKSLRRRIKKIESEQGKRSFIWQSQDPAHFDLLMTWKKKKFSDTGKYDVLSAGWTTELLKGLWKKGPKADLRCELHVMNVDGRPAAMDLGLTDGFTFHSWIVGYDNELHAYSPGMQLLEALVSEAIKLGYDNIDLGAGLDGYKKHYATWPHQAASALWLGSGITAQRAKAYAALERRGEKALKDIPGKIRRRYSQIAACDPSAAGQAKAMWQAIKNGG